MSHGGSILAVITLVLGSLLAAGDSCLGDEVPVTANPIPVIFDTDIGDDIDDTWALALLL